MAAGELANKGEMAQVEMMMTQMQMQETCML